MSAAAPPPPSWTSLAHNRIRSWSVPTLSMTSNVDSTASRVVVEYIGLGSTYGPGAAAVTAVREVSFASPTCGHHAVGGRRIARNGTG